MWVDLNDSQDNKSELKWIVKELRSELRKVKEDNERILKDQEELNTILLAKIHNEEKNTNKDFDQELPQTSPYNKCKGRKVEFSIHNLTLEVKSQLNTTKKLRETSESSDHNK